MATASETGRIALTYRGVLGHRGVRIARESHGTTWTLDLANGVWTLTDHDGNEVHTFTQKDLHDKVAYPGTLPGFKDLCLVGLGPRVHCFHPEPEVLDALKPYVERSERANAPQLARRHRAVGLGFLGLGSLCIAAGLVTLSSALRNEVMALVFILPGLGVGAYFVAVGVRELRTANRFANTVSQCEAETS